MPSTAHDSGHLALGFGHFYGLEEVRRRMPGIELSLLSADPHRVVSRHSHVEAHFVLVLDGLYVSSAAGAPPVSAGLQLIFNPPGTTHRDRFEARDRVIGGRFLTVSVASEALGEGAKTLGMPPHAVVVDGAEAIAVALRLARSCARHDGDAPLIQHALALELLSHAVSAQAEESLNAPAWLRRARECLDDSIGGRVSIADVARAAGVHPVHLARVFRQHAGVSPAEYLRRRRVEQAKSLLQHTTRTISDIALSCGFGDQSHFSNAFRRLCGFTPARYRSAYSRGC